MPSAGICDLNVHFDVKGKARIPTLFFRFRDLYVFVRQKTDPAKNYGIEPYDYRHIDW